MTQHVQKEPEELGQAVRDAVSLQHYPPLNEALDELVAFARRELEVANAFQFEAHQYRKALQEIIEEFRKGKPRGYEGPDIYEEDDPVVIIARAALGSNLESEPES